MKYCADCKYYYYTMGESKKYGVCNHPNNFERDIVSGKFERIDTFAWQTRGSAKKCGISAKWFEPKVSKWDKFKKLFKKE